MAVDRFLLRWIPDKMPRSIVRDYVIPTKRLALERCIDSAIGIDEIREIILAFFFDSTTREIYTIPRCLSFGFCHSAQLSIDFVASPLGDTQSRVLVLMDSGPLDIDLLQMFSEPTTKSVLLFSVGTPAMRNILEFEIDLPKESTGPLNLRFTEGYSCSDRTIDMSVCDGKLKRFSIVEPFSSWARQSDARKAVEERTKRRAVDFVFVVSLVASLSRHAKEK